jgi:hypothetical protein
MFWYVGFIFCWSGFGCCKGKPLKCNCDHDNSREKHILKKPSRKIFKNVSYQSTESNIC